ncbi:MAG TPA: plastocyanin/azurin family copper-binding protein [Conexibacter sp.]|jgi:plastocyanin
MSRRLAVLLAPLAALAVVAAVVVPAQGAKPKPKSTTVGVVDYAFAPARATVRAGTKVVWKWNVANSAPHDVKLVSAPRGVKKFTSPTYTAGISWARTLRVRGTYRLICTYHQSLMHETIVVK